MATLTSTPGDAAALPSYFIAARRYRKILLVLACIFALTGLLLPHPLVLVAATSWLAAAGMLSAGIMSHARVRLMAQRLENDEIREAPAPIEPSADNLGSGNGYPEAVPEAQLVNRVSRWIKHSPAVSEWPQTLATILPGVFAVIQIAQWFGKSVPLENPLTLKMLGGVLLLVAFPLLVLQRNFIQLSAAVLPEAAPLSRVLRLPLTACLCAGISLIAIGGGFRWAIHVEQLFALIVAVAALELILRGVATVFVPWPPIEQRIAVADSAVAGSVLRLSLPTWTAFNSTVQKQFGISLSRGWALSFVQKGAAPVLLGVIVLSWLVTGLTSLEINQRGIYERLGSPVAVFGPGLHVHLPWPLGTVRPVEMGVVHELPIEFVLADSTGRIANEEAEPRVPAEAPAPESADRLWDDAHPFEGSYLIASEENGRQNFQLVNVDMAVIYQIGLSDEAARDAAYQVRNPDAFIQALSGKILVRYLSQHQLLELLGENRDSLAAEFRRRLQDELKGFDTGIDILAISIEAIHPPPGAASAYHDVQAAQIRAGTHVAESRGSAAQLHEQSAQLAATFRYDAVASAAERVGEASATGVQFDADRHAYAHNGDAFLLERRLESAANVLAKTDVVILDHRLDSSAVPTFDWRSVRSVTDIPPGADVDPSSEGGKP